MWVFGMCDTSQTPALGVMCIVPHTLLPILQRHLTSVTIVHSDQWAAYNHVQQLPSVTTHSTVNHSLHFIDPGTRIHTQNVESYWNRVKGKFKHMKGVHEEMISLYVDEFTCREDMDLLHQQFSPTCAVIFARGTTSEAKLPLNQLFLKLPQIQSSSPSVYYFMGFVPLL